jgi:type IV secretory pathway TrbD component
MLEYLIISFQNISFALFPGSPEWTLLVLFAGTVAAAIGFWIKRWIGLVLFLGVILFFLYYSKSFSRLF